jgi:hypothetical protein
MIHREVDEFIDIAAIIDGVIETSGAMPDEDTGGHGVCMS